MIENFHFLRPLWFFATIPLLIFIWYYDGKIKTGRAWSKVCDPHLLPYIMNTVQKDIKKRLPWGGIVSALLVITALSGPVWQRVPQPVFSNQSAMIIALDLSRSMDATDLKPNRITWAKHKILDILSRRKEGQTALIVYAAEPFVVSPLTDDSHNISALVNSLSTDMMPAQGSRPQLAIDKAVELFKNSGIRRGDLLMITDGWPESSTFTSKQMVGHRLSILGVGTQEGAPIPLPDGGFFSDASGAIVIPKLLSGPLQKVVKQGGGYFAELQTDDKDLDLLLSGIKQNPISMQVAETEFTADRWHEEGPWLLLPVLIWAASVFRRQSILVFLLFFSINNEAHALNWQQLWYTPDQQGAAAMAEGKLSEASELFSDKQWQAVAKYRSGQYDAALKSLEGESSNDAIYNRGNTLARLGRLPEAVKAYNEVLKADPNHADAKYNLEVVKKAIKQQEEKKEHQDEGDKKEGDKKEGDKKEGDKKEGDKKEEHNKSGSDDSQESNPGKQQEAEKNKQASGKDQSNEDKAEADKKSAEQQTKDKKEDAAKLKAAQEAAQEAEKKKSAQKEGEQKPMVKSQEQLKSEESKMAMEQWLRRIPDNPGGLLRKKFLNQYRNRNRETSEIEQQW
ncbi:MAG: VWA domain-containing protein [Magnetococcales bacterium]|nr:VWA domain-containing protein [Magnetococcales bacterium]